MRRWLAGAALVAAVALVLALVWWDTVGVAGH
jgi:hypothetical protein